jgi:hypothetical protein
MRWQCPYCKRQFSKLLNLSKHISEKHPFEVELDLMIEDERDGARPVPSEIDREIDNIEVICFLLLAIDSFQYSTRVSRNMERVLRLWIAFKIRQKRLKLILMI